ncbi:hypothetical protein ENC_42990 [Enterobacter hormaechei]|nr:hypothetical protein ENC_42990 [Enterobacter hormaechei]
MFLACWLSILMAAIAFALSKSAAKMAIAILFMICAPRLRAVIRGNVLLLCSVSLIKV